MGSPLDEKDGREKSSTHNSNNWKRLSFCLMGLIVMGFIIPQASGEAAATLTDVFGKIIKIEEIAGAIKGKTDNLPSDPASGSMVNTRASQSSVNNLQNTVNAVKARTDLIPRNPATAAIVNASISGAQIAINSHTDAAVANATTKIVNADMADGITRYTIHSDRPYLLTICGDNTDLLDRLLSVERVSKNATAATKTVVIIFTYISHNKSECLTVSNTDPENADYQVNKEESISGMITAGTSGDAQLSISESDNKDRENNGQSDNPESSGAIGSSSGSGSDGGGGTGTSGQVSVLVPGLPVVSIPVP